MFIFRKSSFLSLVLGAALGLSACGPSVVEGPRDPPPQPPPKPVYADTADGVRSGANVSILYVTTPDGAQSPWAVYDRAHNQVCEPASDRDGRLRCMPARYALPAGGFYTDAACTQPLYIAELSCPDHALTGGVYIKEASGTCNNRRIYQAVPVSTGVYAFEGGFCKPKEPQQPPSTHARYGLGPEVDPAEFPAMSAAIGKR